MNVPNCSDCFHAGRTEWNGYRTGCDRCDARHLSREPWIRGEQMLREHPENEREMRRQAAVEEWERVRGRLG